MKIDEIIAKNKFTEQEIRYLLEINNGQELDDLRNYAQNTLKENVGTEVFFRGLVEFSNFCICDCFYCGIRKSNKNISRFILNKDEVLKQAKWCSEQGFGSIVLQSGERSDPSFINYIESLLKEIKKITKTSGQPEGLGITMCIGEQNEEVYKRLFEAGAHRYLLRIETSNEDLFKRIHPQRQSLENRVKCLESLKKTGFQTGTGVMIGIPGQTIDDLANDIKFFRDMDIDMIGMGPFIVHNDTPMNIYKNENKLNKKIIYELSLKMIAVARIVLKDVNIAATTALQAMYPFGREEGLNFGANVLMPLLTPGDVRGDYLLYEGKPCLEDSAEDCFLCLQSRVEQTGRTIKLFNWGDPVHFKNRSVT